MVSISRPAIRGSTRTRELGLVLLVAACGRSELELAEIDGGGGMLVQVGGAGSPSAAGAGAGGVSAAAGAFTAGAAGDAQGGCTSGSCPTCDEGPLTWSCSPGTFTGICCDHNDRTGALQCRSLCPNEPDPHRTPCDVAGRTMGARLGAWDSPYCSVNDAGCLARICTCGCREGATAATPGLPDTCEPTLFANGYDGIHAIELHDGFVYWTVPGLCPVTTPDRGFGKVLGARAADGSAAIAIFDLPCPFGIAAVDDDIYWTNARSGSGSDS